jgi:hypothetical protein
MNILKAARTLMAQSSDVTNIVSTRIYAGTAPQTVTMPYVVVRLLSVVPSDTKTGSSTIDFCRVQVDCYDTSISTLATLDDNIRLAIDRAPHGDTEGIGIVGIRYENTLGPDVDYFRPDLACMVSSDYVFRILRNATVGQSGVSNLLGDYANDADAIARGGLVAGQLYYLGPDANGNASDVGPHGMLKKVQA